METLLKKTLNSLGGITLMFCLLFTLSACTAISKDAAGKKAQEYLSKHILKDGINAKLGEIKEDGAYLYAVSFQIEKDGKELEKVTLYVTKDGKRLTLGPVLDMSKGPGEQQGAANKAKAQNIPKKDKPEVSLFVMSGCPFGVQAEQAFAPAIKALGDTVNFTPRYILYPGFNGGGPDMCLDKDNKYCSMHGVEEAREDVRQICIWKEQNEKWWDYINKFNEKCASNFGASTTECSKQVANESGVDFAKVETCVKTQTSALLEEELKVAKEANAQGSPTIIINGSQYEGGRSPNDILTAICAGFNKKPEACNVKLDGNAPAAQGGCGR